MKSELITPQHPLWPQQLQDLTEPPEQLWVAGDVNLLLSPILAVVGARACTAYGSRVAADIAGGTSRRFTVVSGGAFGIDAVAHRMALVNGDKTVVVHPAGLDRLYPAAHKELFEQIVDHGGLLISEHSPETVTSRSAFLQRNRIIAALARGVIVVEAGRRSGTLNMAAWAKKLHRPLMAVPGPVTSLASAGCHQLIREGAYLVGNAQDVLDVLQVQEHPMGRV